MFDEFSRLIFPIALRQNISYKELLMKCRSDLRVFETVHFFSYSSMSEYSFHRISQETIGNINFDDCDDLTKLEILKGMTKATALNLHSSNGVNMLPHACQHLCNLRLLYISNSSVDSLRYLGAHFPKLKELTLADCNVRDLDGITSFPNLKILRLPGNEIQSVDQCIHLFQLCHLDVQRNLIDDIASLQWLNLCPKLVSLVLYGNPLYLSIKEGQPKCTETDVIKALPKLKYLDGKPLLTL
ncbi:uncharacterized protein CEXT_102961 [Caerostris extrusa]|uniref:Uncharacterized protein n=1 Tax=Caerostris extrusa TaxID=172846 RepID=A0AAV4X2C8_CAEEX|nr:uncharacterized protein CEXT_102961 [Caerostris extrusa]